MSITERQALARRSGRPVPLLAVVLMVAAGSFGFFRYLDNFWLYRGYAPPRDARYVAVRGTEQRFAVRSAALGHRRVGVLVFLPPGYDERHGRRYTVFYLLHGFPGRAESFLTIVRLGVLEDDLAARTRLRPPILVMPAGPGSLFGPDSAWADGVEPHQGWETFVARELVRAIDGRYATIAARSGRAIGGLSEGGFAALNIALHHPDEFAVVESWSGYTLADRLPRVFGRDSRRRHYNSPLLRLSAVAVRLRRADVFFWFYSGKRDRLRIQSDAFAVELERLHIRFWYTRAAGGHDWRLWRGYADAALHAAIRHLGHTQ
jgi:S-formylglutathione hydrolase FrmB